LEGRDAPLRLRVHPSALRRRPHTAEEYGKQLATITDKATRERLMFGNWEYDDDPS
jgi:phage terminase large subunit